MKPWWNEVLQEKWNEAAKAEKDFLKFKGCRRERTKLHQIFKNKQSNFDREYRREKRRFQRKRQLEIEEMQTNDPKEFWRQLKNLGPQKRTQIPLEVLNENGDLCSDIDYVLKKWHDEFEKLYKCADTQAYDDEFYRMVVQLKEEFEQQMESYDISDGTDENGDENTMLLNQPIQEEEVKKALCHAKNAKSTGIDNVPNEVLKSDSTVTLLMKFFNLCFTKNVIPSMWRKAIITPIPKGHDKDPRVPLNYRGISLLSTMYKLYSYILNSRLSKYLERNKLLSDSQNGFRRLRACIDHLFVITTVIRNRKSKGLPTYCCFVDMKKAFDLLDRKCLLYKLSRAGISGNMYRAIQSIYCESQSAVRINQYYTPWFTVANGVRQGDVLSPTLFSLYINDLSDSIAEENLGVQIDGECIGILMYADDICLMAESEMELQKSLDIVNDWCQKWRMQVNQDKTNVIHFRRRNDPRTQHIFTCGVFNLEVVEKYKYLGCVLDESLDYNTTSKVLSNAASRALGSIISKYRQAGGLTYKVYKKMYDTCVVPILDYCAGVWGHNAHDHMDTVQNRALRSFLGVHRFASNVVINGDMAWCPSKVRRKLCMLKLWNRINAMPNDRMTKKVLMWDVKCGYANTWSADVKHIFQSCNLAYVYENCEVCDTSTLKVAEEQLMSAYIDKWKDDLYNNNNKTIYIAPTPCPTHRE